MPDAPPLAHHIIVFGGSAGALRPLRLILAGLRRDLPAAILAVLHQGESSPANLPQIIDGSFPIRYALNDEPIELGHVYVAPPDHHMMIEPAGRIRLSRGPKQNRFRPSIDPLFRTAARVLGRRVIAVILSGLLDDGSFGMIQVKRFGGVAICQDPADADLPDMPANAMRHAKPDFTLPANQIAPLIERLVGERLEPSPQPSADMAQRSTPTASAGVPSEAGDIADRGDNALTTGSMHQPPSGFTCPQCGGALWEYTEGDMLCYRCHVGHAYTVESMAWESQSVIEQTLWAALRLFEEQSALHRRMAQKEQRPELARRFKERARESEMRTEVVRKLLLRERIE